MRAKVFAVSVSTSNSQPRASMGRPNLSSWVKRKGRSGKVNSGLI